MRALPGQRDTLLDSLLSAAEAVNDLDGGYLYVVSRASDDADAVWVCEAWRSGADHRASLDHSAVRALIMAAGPLIAEIPPSIELIPLGSKGLPDSAI